MRRTLRKTAILRKTVQVAGKNGYGLQGAGFTKLSSSKESTKNLGWGVQQVRDRLGHAASIKLGDISVIRIN